MSKKYIQPSDIEIPNARKGIVLIFGTDSYYYFRSHSGGTTIFYGEKVVWPLNQNAGGIFAGWQDNAKKAIAKHNNKDVILLERLKGWSRFLFYLIIKIPVNIIKAAIS